MYYGEINICMMRINTPVSFLSPLLLNSRLHTSDRGMQIFHLPFSFFCFLTCELLLIRLDEPAKGLIRSCEKAISRGKPLFMDVKQSFKNQVNTGQVCNRQVADLVGVNILWDADYPDSYRDVMTSAFLAYYFKDMRYQR
jgi:hypothetical protein